MKIGIFSDLHLEFAPWIFQDWDPDVFYINAGDTHTDSGLRHQFFQDHSNKLHVMGNHDFWRDPPSDEDPVGGQTVIVGEVKIAAATLWTDLSGQIAWLMYREGINDLAQMPFKVTQADMVEWHERDKKFLLESEADVIVSHHLPSYKSVADRFFFSPYNVAFASELAPLILGLKKPPKLWIHGHTHDSCDYMLGETRVICHPRGYPGEMNFKAYEPKVVEI